MDGTASGVEDGGEIGLELTVFALEQTQELRERFALLAEHVTFILIRHAALLGRFPTAVVTPPMR
jgi:hypothetical protein